MFVILLSNLPEGVTKQKILEHFELNYGKVVDLELLDSQGPQSGPKTAKIAFRSKSTYNRVLNAKITLLGSVLTAEKFRSDQKAEQVKEAGDGPENYKVCVLGIPKSMKDVDLFRMFSKEFGEVLQAYIKRDTRKSKHLGFVTFKEPSSTKKALKKRKIEIRASETLSIKKLIVKNGQQAAQGRPLLQDISVNKKPGSGGTESTRDTSKKQRPSGKHTRPVEARSEGQQPASGQIFANEGMNGQNYPQITPPSSKCNGQFKGPERHRDEGFRDHRNGMWFDSDTELGGGEDLQQYFKFDHHGGGSSSSLLRHPSHSQSQGEFRGEPYRGAAANQKNLRTQKNSQQLGKIKDRDKRREKQGYGLERGKRPMMGREGPRRPPKGVEYFGYEDERMEFEEYLRESKGYRKRNQRPKKVLNHPYSQLHVRTRASREDFQEYSRSPHPLYMDTPGAEPRHRFVNGDLPEFEEPFWVGKRRRRPVPRRSAPEGFYWRDERVPEYYYSRRRYARDEFYYEGPEAGYEDEWYEDEEGRHYRGREGAVYNDYGDYDDEYAEEGFDDEFGDYEYENGYEGFDGYDYDNQNKDRRRDPHYRYKLEKSHLHHQPEPRQRVRRRRRRRRRFPPPLPPPNFRLRRDGGGGARRVRYFHPDEEVLQQDKEELHPYHDPLDQPRYEDYADDDGYADNDQEAYYDYSAKNDHDYEYERPYPHYRARRGERGGRHPREYYDYPDQQDIAFLDEETSKEVDHYQKRHLEQNSLNGTKGQNQAGRRPPSSQARPREPSGRELLAKRGRVSRADREREICEFRDEFGQEEDLLLSTAANIKNRLRESVRTGFLNEVAVNHLTRNIRLNHTPPDQEEPPTQPEEEPEASESENTPRNPSSDPKNRKNEENVEIGNNEQK